MASLIYNLIFFALQVSENLPEPPSQNKPMAPQLPIDDNIWILIIVGLLFGVYILYKTSQATNKAS